MSNLISFGVTLQVSKNFYDDFLRKTNEISHHFDRECRTKTQRPMTAGIPLSVHLKDEVLPPIIN